MTYSTRYIDYRVVEFLKKISEKSNVPINWWLEEKLSRLTIEEAKKIKRTKHQWFGRLKISPKNLELINNLLIEVNKDRERSTAIYMNDILVYLIEKHKNEIEEEKKKEIKDEKKKEKKEEGGIFKWL
jgi:hypothetical protein